jgi:hypothetical protein
MTKYYEFFLIIPKEVRIPIGPMEYFIVPYSIGTLIFVLNFEFFTL